MKHSASVLSDPWTGVELGDGRGVPVAIGGELTPGALLGAHRRAVFCQPRCDQELIVLDEAVYAPDVRAGDVPVLPGPGNPYAILWWSPAVRYVIPAGRVRISRSLRRTLRTTDWTTTLDTDFDGVIAACGVGRKPRWITDEFVHCMRTLRDAGWVHTVEVWEGDQLIAGIFGCALGSVFVMESAFHFRPDAAKVAIADLGGRANGGGITLLDTEVKTDYTVRMGAVAMPRAEYLSRLNDRDEAGTLQGDRRSARYLLEMTWDAASVQP